MKMIARRSRLFNEAEVLLRQFSSLETAFMTTFWCFMPHRFNVTSERIQAVDIDLHTVVELYNSVIDLIWHMPRDFDFQKQAFVKVRITEYGETLRRKRPKKKHFYETSSAEINFSPRENFRVDTFFAILDRSDVELRKRREQEFGIANENKYNVPD